MARLGKSCDPQNNFNSTLKLWGRMQDAWKVLQLLKKSCSNPEVTVRIADSPCGTHIWFVTRACMSVYLSEPLPTSPMHEYVCECVKFCMGRECGHWRFISFIEYFGKWYKVGGVENNCTYFTWLLFHCFYSAFFDFFKYATLPFGRLLLVCQKSASKDK